MTLQRDEDVADEPAKRRRQGEATSGLPATTMARSKLARRSDQQEIISRRRGQRLASAVVGGAGSGSGWPSMTAAARSRGRAIGSTSNLLLVALAILLLVSSHQVLSAPTSTLTTVAASDNKSQPEFVPEPMPQLDKEVRERELMEEMISLKLIDALSENYEKDKGVSTTTNRRLTKRSGISDQRLAEIQMIRALKKQLERASKLAAASQLIQDSGGANEETTNSNTS